MSEEQTPYEKAIQDAEIRKLFPSLEEQMDKLAPELQVELYKMEEKYEHEIQTAKTIRQDIINTECNLHEANIACGTMVKSAVESRHLKIRELRDKWGYFFYNNTR